MDQPSSFTAVRSRIRSWPKQNIELGMLVFILCLGAWVRIHQFGAIPPGLNQDEATAGYDAYSLLHYGIERNGFRFPTHLIAWGSGQYPLLTYLSIPFVYFFGLNVITTRIVVLLANLLALPLFFIVVRNVADRKTALLATFLLSISPWHIMLSRWGLECNLFPAFFLFAVAALLRSLTRPDYLYAAAALFALCLYAYGTAYVIVPLFLLMSLVYGYLQKAWPLRTLLLSALLFIMLALPVLLFYLIHRFDWPSIVTPLFSIPHLPSTPRFENVGNVHIDAGAFVRESLQNIRAGVQLFATRQDGQIWNALPQFGFAYPFTVVFALIGMGVLTVRLWKKPRQPAFLLGAWIISALALIPLLALNINRANILLFPLLFLAATGIAFLGRMRFFLPGLAIVYFFFFIGFSRTYFGPYRAEAAPAFFASFGEAVQYAAKQTDDELCITTMVNMPYIFVLFYLQEDPRVFVDSVVYDNPGAIFQSVASFGRYRFGLDRCASDGIGATVLHNSEIQRFQNGLYRLKPFELYTVAVPLLQSGGG